MHRIARTLSVAAAVWFVAGTVAEARFLQTDPVGYQQNTNLYVYVGNDPLNATDPSGMICTTTGDTVNCDHPQEGVPSVSFPRPDNWPDEISPSASGAAYHNYRHDIGLTDSGGEASRNAAESAAVGNPTPGANDSAATPTGTPNDVGRIAFQDVNPVVSYVAPVANGSTGQEAVINVTVGGHELHAGYIVQYFTVNPATGAVTYHVAGEGNAPTQSNWNPVARLMERNVWGQQAQQFRQAMGIR